MELFIRNFNGSGSSLADVRWAMNASQHWLPAVSACARACPVSIRCRCGGRRRTDPGWLGAVLNISSIGARIKPAGSGYYSATKAALEGLSGSLHKELQPLGINDTLIEPGAGIEG